MQTWNGAALSVDGTDVPIFEPRPFHRRWFSHKFKGPGLRYEIALQIYPLKLRWIHGPYPCGSHPDNKIFTKLLSRILEGTKVVADEGYSHMACITRKSLQNKSVQLREYRKILARHENVNRLFKRFYVLSHRFRHPLHVHQKCFFAVSNIVALELNHFTSRVH